MEFVCQLIFECILEGIFGVTVKNPKLKTWVRTLIYLLFAEAVAVLIGVLSVRTYRSGNISGGIVSGMIALGLGVGFLVAAVYGHKRNWEQD